MDKAFRAGKYARFGLSNYTPQEVEQIVQLSTGNDWVKPSVYEGAYNPLCRLGEDELFPILRKHGMSFHAYR